MQENARCCLIYQKEPTRIDKALARESPVHSRTYFQWLIEKELVWVNQQRAKNRTIVQTGDQIEWVLEEKPLPSVTAQNIPLDILFEDDFLLAINKPAGMVVHPAPGSVDSTLVNALLHYLGTLPSNQNSSREEKLRPGIVHRLDKETSGAILVAKTCETHTRLIEQFAQRKVHKSYLALCNGIPKEQTISTRISRHPLFRQKMTVQTDRGKEAITHIQTLLREEGISLICATPITGRTHQIRVHLESIECSILGDSLYGSKKQKEKWSINRQLLHAHQLHFIHPHTGKQLDIEAPVPSDFAHFLSVFFQANAPYKTLFE